MVMSWFGNVANAPDQATLGTMRHSTIQKFQTDNMNAKSSTVAALPQIGTKLEKGAYKLKLMALRPFGDSNNESDYDIWFSPEIIVE
jgi:hypothetical protein